MATTIILKVYILKNESPPYVHVYVCVCMHIRMYAHKITIAFMSTTDVLIYIIEIRTYTSTYI